MSFCLSRIEQLDGAAVDTVGLADILGDPQWHTIYMFNYMYDLPWVAAHLAAAPHVDLHIVHGFKTPNNDEGALLKADAQTAESRHPNLRVYLHGVRLVNQYATHHSKIIVLVGDGQLQLVIHTANMIEFDWANMTQGLWLSPVLAAAERPPPSRFRGDFARYLMAYNNTRITKLAEALQGYDFSPVTDTLVASVPGTHAKSLWGLRRLKRELEGLPVDEAVCQISSIATLPQRFLAQLASALHCPLTGLRVVFPTMENVRASLNGWHSGQALHLKRRTAAHTTQYDRLRPHLRQWAGPRARAAPHIKTYAGFTDGELQYFLLTSANLSPQAWGSENAQKGTLWIQSWECGVLRKSGRGVALPYALPLAAYGPADTAWSADTFADTVAREITFK